jgi:hypothetical protein
MYNPSSLVRTQQLTNSSSPRGLASVPAPLQHFREEVGLSVPSWESLGAEWKALAALWLQTEILLAKSDHTNISFNQIPESSIPDGWKEWMNAKLMNTDAKRPAELFGKTITGYLKGLPSSTMKKNGTVMTETWCRPGKTGIIGLLLCLNWQAVYSGTRNYWKQNVERVEDIFNTISAEPSL